MRADISRKTFNRSKHYSAVLQQQGRVSLDADWNEQQAITQYRDETEASDVIGPCGAPISKEGGFEVSLIRKRYGNLTLSQGRLYVNGILCENEEELQIGASDSFSMPTEAGRYLIYLDVWQRAISALDDPDIREKALGGPDTAMRLKTTWQARWIKVDGKEESYTADRLLPAKPNGMLTADIAEAPTSRNLCALPPAVGYQGLENHLYRVEIHQGGTREQARWKWSRENATVVAQVKPIDGLKLAVDSVGHDEVLGFSSGQWAELVDDRMELAGSPGQLVKIAEVDRATNQIVIEVEPRSALPSVDTNRNARLRRWDQTGASATNAGLAMTNSMTDAWIPLEDGIQVLFSAGNYQTGDYWLIPARTEINNEKGGIEWPHVDHDDKKVRQPQPPHGIEHHYCPLALVQFADDGTFSNIQDCRRHFLSLTELTARVVCTLVVTPQSDLKRVLESIDINQDARICFQVGQYELDETVTLKDMGHLLITGSGPGTKVIVGNKEAALSFENCRSVSVRDMTVQSLTAVVKEDTPGPENMGKLKGVLNFLDCPSVSVEDVHLQCASVIGRAATCITVRNQSSSAGVKSSVRIRRCDLTVGRQQIGMLIVNYERTQVEDNVVRMDPATPDPQELLGDKRYRLLLFKLRDRLPLGLPSIPPTSEEGQPSRPIYRKDNIRRFNQKLGQDDNRQAIIKLIAKDPPIAWQGIVVAGELASDVRIINNTVQDVLQGIHIGLSQSENTRGDPLKTEVAIIAGNTIEIDLPLIADRNPHGIFVGNCNSLLVENNFMTVKRSDNMPITGIYVHGHMGPRMIIRQNHLNRCTTGIEFVSLGQAVKSQQWIISDNTMPEANPPPVQAPPSSTVRVERNC